MNDQERQQFLQSVREGKISFVGVEKTLAQDLNEAGQLYQDKQQRLETVLSMAQTLRADLLTLSGQISALSKILCQAEEERRDAKPAFSMEEFGKTLGASKVEFVPSK